MNKLIVIAFFVFLLSVSAHAAPGDVIITDLHDAAAASNVEGKRSIVTYGGAPGGTGVAVVLHAPTGNVSAPWTLAIPNGGAKEITIVWWERFDVWPIAWSSGGIKSIRPYHGNGSGDYFGTLISFHGGNSMYSSSWRGGVVDFNTLDVVTDIVVHKYTDDGYPTLISGNTYETVNKIKWSWEGMGTEWRKMRQWIKMPTNLATADAEAKLWIDNKLHYHLYNATVKDTGTSVDKITRVAFAPVDESATPHEHWYDEITIYEGYVPPDGSPLPTPDPEDPVDPEDPTDPTPTTSGPILRTGSSLLRVGDGVLRVQ